MIDFRRWPPTICVLTLYFLLAFDALLASSHKNDDQFHKAFPILEPDEYHTRLSVSRVGLEAIARIKEPIAVVSVIGPYRSGKSFLLNQLLALSCNEGFGVGHMRDTKTKGMWVWGEPHMMKIEGVSTAVLFVDTEGFESVGKSSVYDDRIFALAAVVSSVLIYNLPETVKEADIEKLSFAVELAEEFYERAKGRQSRFDPARLLWLIQRDFLEGKSVEKMVQESLSLVPNPDKDPDIEQVNKIRQSLALMAANGTAFGLRQPHLERTKLCELADSELDSKYVQQRDRLRALLFGLVAPKKWGGQFLNGQQFVRLLEQTLDALNKGKIPTAGSVVRAFNKLVVEKAVAEYRRHMLELRLPATEAELLAGHGKAAQAARLLFENEKFGSSSEESSKDMEDSLVAVLKEFQSSNELASSRKCESLYVQCEDVLAGMENMRLPSISKFDASFHGCNHTVEETCLGPSKDYYMQRLGKLWARERSSFLKDYNQRLFNYLVVFSLLMVVVGRFVIKWFVVEAAAWALFVFLETYTRVFWSNEGLYFNPAWRWVVLVWESVVFNPFLDLDRWVFPLFWVAAIGYVVLQLYRIRRKYFGRWFRKPRTIPV